MKRVTLQCLRVLAWLAVGVGLLASLAGLALWRLKGDKLLSVQSGSMVPVLHRGDAVAVEKVAVPSLRVGDIVSYVSSINPGEVVTHRLVRLDLAHGVAITKGDALTIADPPVPLRQILGRVGVRVPKFGLVVDGLRRPIGLVIGAYTPALAVVAFEIRRLARSYGWQHYRLASK